jgi:hypothetical protein
VGDLGPYRAVLRSVKGFVARDLAAGTFSPRSLAIRRLAIELMESQLAVRPELVLHFDEVASSSHSAPQLWWLDREKAAERLMDPEVRDRTAFRLKMKEYERHVQAILDNLDEPRFYDWFGDHRLTVRNNEATKQVLTAICHALLRAAREHRFDDDFLEVSATQAMARLLGEERFDLMVALHLATQLPSVIGKVKVDKPESRPFYVTVVESVISFIPIVGQAVAAYEALSGKDLFGYALSDEERAILAASVFLPLAGRAVNEGKAVYSGTRMAANFGGDAVQWNRALAVGERITANELAQLRLAAARQSVTAGRRLSPKAAAELEESLRAIDIAKAGTATPTVLTKRAVDALEDLVKFNGRFRELDANAIERLAAKKTRSHVDGQLFEEMLENRVMLWLNDPAGRAALGINPAHIRGRLEFIPGHLLRDDFGLQLTDGMVVSRMRDGSLRILAIFECKAGARAATGLSFKGKSRSRFSKDEEAVLKDEVDRAMKELEQRAKRSGKPVAKTRKEVEREFLNRQSRGQIGSDIERLHPSAGPDMDNLGPKDLGKQFIHLGGEPVRVHFSPTLTKFFGVLPMDVSGTAIARELADAGVRNFEILGMGIPVAELKAAGRRLSDALGIKK